MPKVTPSDIQAFTSACDNMIASKYILVDRRLGDVLKSIASTREVFNLISECMVNFSFERELETATARIGKIVLPEEPHKTIAFIFCLLNLLDDKKINFNQFLNKYYSSEEGGVGPYANFCNKVVLRFKNVIVATLLGEETQINEEDEQSETPALILNNELIERLAFLVKDYRSYVLGVKKIKGSKCTRNELLEEINALNMLISEQRIEFMYGIILGIKYSIGKDKELKRRLIEIEEIVLNLLSDASAKEDKNTIEWWYTNIK